MTLNKISKGVNIERKESIKLKKYFIYNSLLPWTHIIYSYM